MSAYHFVPGGDHGDDGLLCLHSDEAERFARAALRPDADELMGPDATYVGLRLAEALGIKSAEEGD